MLTPFSISLVCYETGFILFDSHAHAGAGALLARVPISRARAYFQHFFATYYLHLTLLQLQREILQLMLLLLTWNKAGPNRFQ